MPFGIGGSYSRDKEKSETNATRDTTKFGTSGGTQSEQGLSELLENLIATSKGTTTKGTETSRNALSTALEGILAEFQGFSSEAADESSRESVTSAINEVLNSGLPDVRTANTSAGGYNSTTTKLLRDNVLSQASTAGARVKEETRARFEQNRSSLIGNFLDTIATIQDSQVSVIEDDVSQRVGTEKDTNFTEFAQEEGESTSEVIQERSKGKSSGFALTGTASTGG